MPCMNLAPFVLESAFFLCTLFSFASILSILNYIYRIQKILNVISLLLNFKGIMNGGGAPGNNMMVHKPFQEGMVVIQEGINPLAP